MKRYKIQEFLSEAGHELQVLMDVNGMPSYYPNLFATVTHRRCGRSTATIMQSLRSIRMAMDWFHAKHGMDFNDRIVNADPLLFKEAKPLGDFLKMTSKRQETELKVVSESKSEGKGRFSAKRLKSIEPRHGTFSESALDTNAPATSAAYINCVCNYLEWIYKLRLRSPLIENFSSERQAQAKDGLEHLRAQAPRIRARINHDERLWSITEEITELVESIIQPDSKRNPWKSLFLRDRNYLLWRVFYDTGGRRDEVRNVKVDDVNLNIPGVTFRVSKTIPRTVPFKNQTRTLLEQFLLNHWRHLPKEARQVGYLFTNSKGGQLSNRTLNDLFEAIRHSDPGIPDWLSPHTLRRTWNDNLSKAIDSLPEEKRWNSEKEVMVRNRLMGWSENGKTASTYLGRHITEAGIKIMEQMIDGIQSETGAEHGGNNEK